MTGIKIHKQARALGTTLFFFTFITLGITGCSGPIWQFPGGKLAGAEQPLDAQSIQKDGGVIQLETNPDDPYSVNIGYVAIEGRMYIDPAESRTWYQNIKDNPLIRVRFDGHKPVHPAIAVAETDPAILARFEKDRNVLRLEARKH